MVCGNPNCRNNSKCDPEPTSTKCCIVAFAPRIHFFSQPRVKSFNVQDGETTLFCEKLILNGTKQLMIDTSITGELVTCDNGVHVIYKMYVDGRQACQSGYEGDPAIHAPALQSVSMTFGSNMCHTNKSSVTVKITGRMVGGTASTCPSWNCDNKAQSFLGAKGCFLRVLVF